ncbi:MAG: hypothetical protein C4519_21700 [Desulfobacteraceae bacterium]|nr:MAG: hypothetical protein C4519_21700 [Desulfobacteraceae bacterium]
MMPSKIDSLEDLQKLLSAASRFFDSLCKLVNKPRDLAVRKKIAQDISFLADLYDSIFGDEITWKYIQSDQGTENLYREYCTMKEWAQAGAGLARREHIVIEIPIWTQRELLVEKLVKQREEAINARSKRYLPTHSAWELPPAFAEAIEIADTSAQLGEIDRILSHAYRLLTDTQDENSSQSFRLIDDLDPVLIFPFLRRRINLAEVKRITTIALERLEGECPCRTNIARELIAFCARRLMGDSTATYPLWHGPPGAGKSHMGRSLAIALSAAGYRTEFLHVGMGISAGRNAPADEIKFQILGSDSRYGNSSPGALCGYAAKADVRIVVVLLDEVDKSLSLKPLLMNFLDPDQPLVDTYLQRFFPTHDMRHKTYFCLSANDISGLGADSEDDPLWTRMNPVYFSPYTREEIITVASRVAASKLSLYCFREEEWRKLATDAVDNMPDNASFRLLMGQIGRLAFMRHFPYLETTIPAAPAASRQRIGF